MSLELKIIKAKKAKANGLSIESFVSEF